MPRHCFRRLMQRSTVLRQSGAEALLKLRAVRGNGDFDAYWP